MMLLRVCEALNVIVVEDVPIPHWQRYYSVTFLGNKDRRLQWEVE